MDIS
jgi:hypothetical protein